LAVLAEVAPAEHALVRTNLTVSNLTVPNLTVRGVAMRIRWGRVVMLTACSLFLLAAVGAFVLWFRMAGVPAAAVKAAVQPDAVQVAQGAPQVMRIWPGKAPGSENWTQQEVELKSDSELIVRNVVDPTLTAYFPPAGKANGTAMIICPGGGFHMLTMNSEGVAVAQDLNAIGITAFILRYRLTETNAAFMAVMMHRLNTPGAMQPIIDKMTPLITADGQQAIRVVRAHAAQWGVNPDRIGLIGFSAGGYLSLNVAMHHDAGSAPDFLAAIYPLAPTPLAAPPAKIPLFELAADDDPLVPPADNAARIYSTWHTAGVPAELHIFTKGGHGFGMRKQNLPIDTWPELLHQWLGSQGLLTPAQTR
jgi:acetyl esterase/lipase